MPPVAYGTRDEWVGSEKTTLPVYARVFTAFVRVASLSPPT